MSSKEIKISGGTKTTSSKQFERSKLHGSDSDFENQGSDSSLRAIVVLIIVIIIVAIGGAYFIKTMQSRKVENNTQNLDQQPTQVPENLNASPEVSEVVKEKWEEIVSTKLLEDSSADNMPLEKDFLTKDFEVTNEEEADFALETISAFPYQSFNRFIFKFSTDAKDLKMITPPVFVNYRGSIPEIEVTFRNVITDNSGLEKEQILDIEDSVVAGVVKIESSEEGKIIYQFSLNKATGYSLKYEGSEVILDIKEVEKRAISTVSATPEATPDATKIAEEEKDTQTEEKEASEGKPLTKDEKSISSDIAGNIAGIKGFSYDDTIEKFIYRLTLSNENVPNVTSSVEGNNIVVKVSNLSFDASVSKPEYAYEDFTVYGVKNVQEMKVEYSGGVSTYTFTLEKVTDYKLEVGTYKENNVILIEFMH